MESLPTYMFQVEDDLPFFFNFDNSPLYEADIMVERSEVLNLTTTTKTIEYEGSQPAATPKTGDIQAPAGVALIINSLDLVGTSSGANNNSSIKIRASDTADTADGTILHDFGTVAVDAAAQSIPFILILPANKFLTVEAAVTQGSPVFKVFNVRTIERGADTRDLDPFLQ